MIRIRVAVTLILTLHILVLLWVAWGLPIGPAEAKIFYADSGPVSYLMHLGKTLFPDSGFLDIRLPFLFIHLINLYLFYQLSLMLLKEEVSVIISVLIYLFLPGIVSSAVLASSTGMILALYQLFLILWLRGKRVAAMALLPLFVLIDRSSVVLYSALLLYALFRRERDFLAWVSLLFAFALWKYGFNVQGKPKNYFADTIGLYAAIFSPLLFLYFFYAMYRILLKGEKSIIWFVSFTVMLVSLLFSIRQKIPIQDFAPYVVVAVPLMVKLFFQTYRVRLPQFRRRYLYLAAAVLGMLALNTAVLLFHKPFFLLMKEPERHFAAPFYFPYWCAQALKSAGIENISVGKSDLAYQLRYYGIGSDNGYTLEEKRCKGCEKVSIRYRNRELKSCYVSKINSYQN
ncbi:membrane protein [Hydrogenimonas sp.]|nr:membrane protein [Hydrogenimonas sp.]